MTILPNLLVAINVLLSFSKISAATDTINQLQPLSDGKTLVSESGSFELGFFTPSTSSTNRYVGIWYKNIPVTTVVWVANRDNPIRDDNSSTLSINKEGNLVLLNKNNVSLWSTKATKTTSAPIAQLLDSGNLVVRDEKDESGQNYLWQSFDYPTDTCLPGMKLGWDFRVGLDRRLTAWKSWDDPSSGDFTNAIVPTNNPESFMWKGSQEVWRSGPMDGLQPSGTPSLQYNQVIEYTYVDNKDELYWEYNVSDNSVITRIVMNETLYLRQRVTWSNATRAWIVSSNLPGDTCDNYNICGPNGICVINDSPICRCLDGYQPRSTRNWTQNVWSQGCVRGDGWRCGVDGKDGFDKFSNAKVPDTRRSWINASLTLEECQAKCLENCSCTAFANSDIKGQGSGCAMWFDDLLDLRQIPNGGQDLYVRLATSDRINQVGKGRSKEKEIVISTVASIIAVLLILTFIYWRSKTKIQDIIKRTKRKKNETIQEDFEVPLFDFASIAHATNDFSDDNKLGEGGFGPVFLGKLTDEQEIAVKRLSQTSGQGVNEFINEVKLCANLQHRNLVKVLGCCIQDEKLLIYEFMANKSLDFFLFDSTKSKLLDWPKRFFIINGIARGLLYLHQDSRLRIIHRDLKASNILLDNEMNPKISDFGLARMCGGDQVEGNTSRVVGTYGYMAPEYAFDGIFSIKSDVFSFGVLLLEIVSGKRNSGLSNAESNIIGKAWRLWKEGTPVELIDACLKDSFVLSEVLRCIHIALLCVQHHPNDRPTMASVILMLSNENALPQPKEPSFLIHNKIPTEGESSSENKTSSSTINQVTISLLRAR